MEPETKTTAAATAKCPRVEQRYHEMPDYGQMPEKVHQAVVSWRNAVHEMHQAGDTRPPGCDMRVIARCERSVDDVLFVHDIRELDHATARETAKKWISQQLPKRKTWIVWFCVDHKGYAVWVESARYTLCPFCH